jgi:hypothetical protein
MFTGLGTMVRLQPPSGHPPLAPRRSSERRPTGSKFKVQSSEFRVRCSMFGVRWVSAFSFQLFPSPSAPPRPNSTQLDPTRPNSTKTCAGRPPPAQSSYGPVVPWSLAIALCGLCDLGAFALNPAGPVHPWLKSGRSGLCAFASLRLCVEFRPGRTKSHQVAPSRTDSPIQSDSDPRLTGQTLGLDWRRLRISWTKLAGRA